MVVNLREGAIPSRPLDPTRSASHDEALVAPSPKSPSDVVPLRERKEAEGGTKLEAEMEGGWAAPAAAQPNESQC